MSVKLPALSDIGGEAPKKTRKGRFEACSTDAHAGTKSAPGKAA